MKMFGSGIFAVTAVVAFVTWVSVTQSKDAQWVYVQGYPSLRQ
jgi:hypothetical protein